MSEVVVIGGGWAGVAAAVTAAKRGCRVTLLEKNDRLLGYGLVAGEIFQNGRLTICLEMEAMGVPEFFKTIDRVTRHRDVVVPGVENTVAYDVLLIENEISKFLDSLGVRVVKESRAVDVSSQDGVLKEIVLDNGEILSGQAFVDCSGTAGPMSLCRRHGWGCVACINRCPVFGGRVSITAKMGVAEKYSQNAEGKVGVASQGMNILKETLDQGLVKELEKSAVLLIPVPPGFSEQKFEIPKGDQKSFEENLVLIDNGFAKIKSRPFIPLERLRRVRGFERAVYFDPAGGSRGNSIRFLAVAPRDMDLKVKGTKNLFAAGEKQGLLVGVCEAIVSGLLAGHNAARSARQEETLCLPRSTAVGEMLAFTQERLDDPSGYTERYSCLGGSLFNRLKEKGLYIKDRDEIMRRIKKEGLSNIL